MRNLSSLQSNAFDLVYQGNSMGYVPDAGQVFSEVARVLRSCGCYRVDFQQPAVSSVEWNGTAYCITRPYCEKRNQREDGGIEFRHNLSDIFNGLIDMGFSIERP